MLCQKQACRIQTKQTDSKLQTSKTISLKHIKLASTELGSKLLFDLTDSFQEERDYLFYFTVGIR